MEIIIGAFVSLVVQTTKKYFGTSEYVTLFAALTFSIVASLVYFWLQATDLFESFTRILMAAGGFYVYILKRFEN